MLNLLFIVQYVVGREGRPGISRGKQSDKNVPKHFIVLNILSKYTHLSRNWAHVIWVLCYSGCDTVI